MTPTGRDAVKRLLGDRVMHCYAPYDFRFAVERFLQRSQPKALLILETEIWPNMIACSKARGIPVMLLNARLSERSAGAYGRVAGLIKPVLQQLDWVACQYPADRDRFTTLGVNPEQLECVGNIKFDVAEPDQKNAANPEVELVAQCVDSAARNCWLAGSTHAGEETIILAAHAELLQRFPELCLILVPRHPERFASVYGACADFTTLRLSPVDLAAPQVILVDRMGLLGELYQYSDVAFIGGSLVAVGGHNPIEAAAASVPMLMGPKRFNFSAVCDAFMATGSLIEVRDAKTIAQQMTKLIGDQQLRIALGVAAKQVVADNAGTTTLLLDGVLERLPDVDDARR